MTASSSAAASSRLFRPLSLSGKEIHRVAMAPLTRMRADKDSHVPKDIVPEYYAQRSSPGTLIISEATSISVAASGYPTAPGIYSEEQKAEWKTVVKGVHAKGGVIYLQLWTLGRANQGDQPGVKTVSASDIPLKGTSIIPEPLTEAEIEQYVQDYRQAALNAIEVGFDGVEIHNANGYLLDQFLQTTSNKRTDSYGGSIENRARFSLAVVKAVADAVGQERVGIRFSPWSTFQDMQMSNPLPTFTYVLEQIVKQYPKFGYVHYIEARAWAPGSYSTDGLEDGVVPSNDYFRAIVRGLDWKSIKDEKTVFSDPTPEHPILFLSASSHTREGAPKESERTGDVIVFGRAFISTPDLPYRIKNDIDFNEYDRNTFYTPDKVGYTDYPYANDESKNLGIKAQA